MTTDYFQYWNHVPSGETFHVVLDDKGDVTQACGPLDYKEVTEANLGEFNDDPELAEDINGNKDSYCRRFLED